MQDWIFSTPCWSYTWAQIKSSQFRYGIQCPWLTVDDATCAKWTIRLESKRRQEYQDQELSEGMGYEKEAAGDSWNWHGPNPGGSHRLRMKKIWMCFYFRRHQVSLERRLNTSRVAGQLSQPSKFLFDSGILQESVTFPSSKQLAWKACEKFCWKLKNMGMFTMIDFTIYMKDVCPNWFHWYFLDPWCM